MGLQSAIGYEGGSKNRLRSGILWLTGTRAGAWAMSKTVTKLDAAVHRLSRGKYTASAVIAGLPVVMLTTIGVKSGKERTSPVVGIPMGEDLAVIGSNFGQKKHPGWVHNLRANPNATITYGDRSVPVIARTADEAEYEQAFAIGGSIASPFHQYRDRVSGREINVFVLETAAG
jgi:deazaflavin-dependent oxidoreductase (nitroreductase family)